MCRGGSYRTHLRRLVRRVVLGANRRADGGRRERRIGLLGRSFDPYNVTPEGATSQVTNTRCCGPFRARGARCGGLGGFMPVPRSAADHPRSGRGCPRPGSCLSTSCAGVVPGLSTSPDRTGVRFVWARAVGCVPLARHRYSAKYSWPESSADGGRSRGRREQGSVREPRQKHAGDGSNQPF